MIKQAVSDGAIEVELLEKDANMPVEIDDQLEFEDPRFGNGESPESKKNFDEDDPQRMSKEKMEEDASNAASLRPKSLAQSSASNLHESGLLIDIDQLLKQDLEDLDGKKVDLDKLRMTSRSKKPK